MKWILLGMNISCMVAGQIAWKSAVKDVTEWNLYTLYRVILSFHFILGGVLYVAATGFWLILLSKLPLSVAYPMQSLSYIIGIIAGVFLFKEVINTHQVLGVILILIGVILLSWKVGI